MHFLLTRIGVTQLKTRKSSIEENDGRIPNQDVTPGSVMLHVWGPGTSQNAGNVPIPPCYSTPLESGHSKQGEIIFIGQSSTSRAPLANLELWDYREKIGIMGLHPV